MGYEHAEADGALPLAELQRVVTQQEMLGGPLVAMHRFDARTRLVFDDAAMATSQRTEVVVCAGHPPERPGFVLVCAARCLVGGAPAMVAAYRRAT